MALETRLLTASTSFAIAATSWAKTTGLLTEEGEPTSIYPVIIGMPSGSNDLAGFNIGIIQNNRTIKQAFQDLETAVDARMFAGNNLSDLPSPATARTNLGLASAATWPVGTAGSVVPLLSTVNGWSGKQSFGGGAAISNYVDMTGSSGTQTTINILNGSSRRWSLYKEETADTAVSTGSDFRIGRFNNSGVKIDDPFSISRTTGTVILSQPLPITSGGTGANSLGSLRTQLAINNVDNTADINKPVSSPTQTALNLKFDRVGGPITGFVTTTTYIRAGSMLISDGNTDEGGQLILGYRNTTGITGQTNSSWNIDVDANNALRIFRQNSAGVVYTPIQINEGGNSVFSGNGEAVTIFGSGGASQGLTVRNSSATSSSAGDGFVAFKNTEGTFVSHLLSNMNTDGSSDLSFSVTTAGNRSTDRRAENLKITPTSIIAGVPINGRAYPRLADGNSVNFNWNGQPGQPTWLWGGNDGTNMFIYSPSNMSVASAANSTQLNSIGGGNAGGYIRRTNDSNGNGILSRQLVLSGSDATNDVWSSPIEIREVANIGSGSSSTTYAPALTFHWSNNAASSIKLHADGSFRFQRQNTTVTYANVWGAEFYSNANYRIVGGGGLYFDTYSRGVVAAESGGGYGHLNTIGSGYNGYGGYSINTWATFMANGTDSGIYSTSQGRWLVRFDNSGNAFFSANVSAYSDERLKQNIRPIDNVAARRAAMANAAILYERDGETRLGFGAQTLELGNPELVTTGTDPLETKSVNYGDAVAVLAADNQMLALRLEIAETKNTILENQIAEISARLQKAGL